MKKKINLSLIQQEMLIGILLGDAHLETQNNAKTYRLCVEQSFKHEAYVMHLYDVFKNLVTTPPKLYQPKAKRNNPTDTAQLSTAAPAEKATGEKGGKLRFKTISCEAFCFYAQLFYTNKTKTIDKNIHKWLSPRALAYWYMDDGARKGANRSGKRFHTEGFTQSEVIVLCEALNKFGIATTVNKQNLKAKKNKPLTEQKIYYILNVLAKGDLLLTELIRPFIQVCFEYKL
jgi:hypothetical protein